MPNEKSNFIKIPQTTNQRYSEEEEFLLIIYSRIRDGPLFFGKESMENIEKIMFACATWPKQTK